MRRRKRKRITARWARGPQFAEVAEVMGVETDRIVASVELKGVTTVLVSLDPADDSRVFRVFLTRGPDRILRRASEPEELPGFFDNVREQLRHKLGEGS